MHRRGGQRAVGGVNVQGSLCVGVMVPCNRVAGVSPA